MKKLLIAILLLGAVFAKQYGINSDVLIVNTNGYPLNINDSGIMSTSNSQLKFTSNGWLIISNAGAKLTPEGYQITSNIAVINANVVASNLTVSSLITNSCPLGITNSGTNDFNVMVTGGKISVTNIPQVSLLVNNVNVTNIVRVTNAYAIYTTAITNSIPLIISNTINANVINQQIDPTSGAVETIDHLHAEVHAGNVYRSTIYSNSLAASAIVGGVLKTGSNTTAHTYAEVNFYGQATWFVYQNPVRTNGRLLTNTSFNLNMCSNSLVSDARLLALPANITNYGTLRNQVFLPGGTGAGGRTSSSYRTSIELVICSNSEVFYFLSNASGQASDVSVEIFWYDE